MSLKQRHREPEIQDELDLDTQSLHDALAGLKRINFWSGSVRALWSPIRRLAAADPGKTLSILDIATGAGDMPIALWKRGQRAGLKLDVEGCDFNPRTVAYATEHAEKNGAHVRFFACDVLQQELPRKYDVITCSLFLHHLSDEDAVVLLRRMAAAANRLIVISDLVRGVSGVALAYLATRVLNMSEVNRVDSVRSVRAAFSIAEAVSLAKQAGLGGFEVRKNWPCRFLLTWRR